MITIAKSFEWDMGHRVPNHQSLCSNPHGHRYKLTVEVSGPVNKTVGDSQQDMVIDFGKLKEIISQKIIQKLDHSFMYWEEDKVMKNFADANKGLKMNEVSFVPTAESIVESIALELNGIFTKDLPDLTLQFLELFETPNSKSIWRKDKVT